MASRISSQDLAIKVIDKMLSNFIKSNGHIRPHFIVSGKSGSGKSFILERLGSKHGISTINVNAAQITREGISGNSLSKALEPLKKLQQRPVIVFMDEFDKLFLGTSGHTGDERAGVQSEILHIISSGVCQVIADYGHYDEINTRNCLFVFAGAFRGESNLSPERLMEMGMYPELLGRVNMHVEIPDIPLSELVNAMRKDPLLTHYFTVEQITDKEKQEEVKEAISVELEKQFLNNVIGYRLITRLIHQYFIFDGKFPEYKDAEAQMVAELQEELGVELNFGD